MLSMGMHALQVLGLLSRYSSRIDSYSVVCLLQGCISQGVFRQGILIHTHIIKTGLQFNIFVWTALVHLYTKFGYMEDATKVFNMMPDHNLVLYNVLIAGYARHGLGRTASTLFKCMLSNCVSPNIGTLTSMIQACVSMKDREVGKFLHSFVLLHGLDGSNIFFNNALIDMYGKCGSLDDARQVFDTMPQRDSVSWNAMMCVYALWGLFELNLILFCKMLQAFMPNDASLLCMVNVCASLGFLDYGMSMYQMIAETRAKLTIDMANAIIDMYGKCGDTESAFWVFIWMGERDCVSWNAMITGLSQSGFGRRALEMLCEMEGDGIKMSHVAVLGTLSACSHVGLVECGCLLSAIMMQRGSEVLSIQEHYSSLIDLLGRAGLLEEAWAVIYTFPFQPSRPAWRILLSGCRTHNDLEKVQAAADCLWEIEPESDAAHLLLWNANAYAAGRYIARLEEA